VTTFPRLRRYAIAVAATYLAFGVAWIVGSDRVIEALADDAAALSRMQSAKGLLFIAVSTIAVYLAVRLARDPDALPLPASTDDRERPRLRWQLLLLAGATALPLIALLAYNVQREAMRDQDAAARAAQDIARVVATDAARIVLDARTTVEALARRPDVSALDAERCDAQIAEVAKLLPYVANAMTIRSDGSIACAALPVSQGVPERPDVRRTAHEGRAGIGRLARGPGTGQWVVPVAAVLRTPEGAAPGTIVLTIDVGRLAPHVPPPAANGSFVALVDAGASMLMRVPDEGRVGENAYDSAIVQAALREGDGIGRERGRRGTDLIFGFARVAGTDWVALAATPASVALAASRESAARSAVFAALVLLVAGIAAYAAATRIERPMRAIARTARSVAEGDLAARAPVAGSHETAEVALQLNRLLERLPRIESQLRESERRLETVLGAAQEAIVLTDAQDRIVFVNGAAAKLLGHADATALVGEQSRDVLPDALVEDAARRLDERRAGRGDRYEIRIRAHDGAIRWLFVSATPLTGDAGAFDGVLAMLYDVTERKEVEERLARITRLYWALSEINEAIVRTTDAATLFADACRVVVQEGGFVGAFVMALERELDALVPAASAGAVLGPLGAEPLSLAPGAPFAEGVVASAIRSGEPEIVNDVFADDRTLPARAIAATLGIRGMAAFPLRCEGQVVATLVVFASDVDYFDIGLEELLRQVADDVSFGLGIYERATARDRAEAEVRELNAELERRVEERTARLTEANRELEAFSYSVSHDLRAPLRAINGFAQLLSARTGASLDAEARRLLERIVGSSAHMGRLIDDLLAFAQLGRQAIDVRPVPLAPLFGRLVDELRGAIDEAGAVVDVAADLPEVLGEPTLVAQIFANLLSNAIAYRRPGVAPRVDVRWRDAGERIEVAVSDNGVGIAAEDQRQVFEPFVRLHKAGEHPGTGIGLALAAKAATLLCGEITVESAPGVGSTFRVLLPPAPAQAAGHAGPPAIENRV
jgi:PAS domain S-box-containing protein